MNVVVLYMYPALFLLAYQTLSFFTYHIDLVFPNALIQLTGLRILSISSILCNVSILSPPRPSYLAWLSYLSWLSKWSSLTMPN